MNENSSDPVPREVKSTFARTKISASFSLGIIVFILQSIHVFILFRTGHPDPDFLVLLLLTGTITVYLGVVALSIIVAVLGWREFRRSVNREDKIKSLLGLFFGIFGATAPLNVIYAWMLIDNIIFVLIPAIIFVLGYLFGKKVMKK